MKYGFKQNYLIFLTPFIRAVLGGRVRKGFLINFVVCMLQNLSKIKVIRSCSLITALKKGVKEATSFFI